MEELRQKLKRFFSSRPDEWVSGSYIEQLAISKGFKASHADRRLREAESGWINKTQNIPCEKFLDKRKDSKGHVEYKWRKTEKIVSRYQIVGDKVIEIKDKQFV